MQSWLRLASLASISRVGCRVYSRLSVSIEFPERLAAPVRYLSKEGGAMDELAKIDHALDEVLVQLGGMVLRLSSPQVTRSVEERHALVRSVNQYSICAARSCDPRVHQLKSALELTIKPRLRLVASR
jgi:hypothetical protein